MTRSRGAPQNQRRRQPQQSPRTPWWKRPLVWVGGVIGAVVLAIATAFGTGVGNDLYSAMFGRHSPRPTPSPTKTVSSPTLTRGNLGAATVTSMQMRTTTPGPRYQVRVKISDLPPKGYTLWLMALIYPEPGKIKDTLYFAKAPVPSVIGNQSVEIQYCHSLDPALHRGLEVAAADIKVSKILAQNRTEEDNCVKNSDLTSLVGATPVSGVYPFSAAP